MRAKRLSIQLLSSAGILALLAVNGALAQKPRPEEPRRQKPSPVTAQEAALWAPVELASHACKVYLTNCYRCHRPGGFAAETMDYVMNRDQLVARKRITPNDLRKSMAYQLPLAGDMPPDKALETPEPALVTKYVTKELPEEKLTGAQILGLWVLAGAPAWETTGSGDGLQCK